MDGAWWVPVIVSFALLLLTAVGAVAAWVQARTAVDARRDALVAQSASESARDETMTLARKATDAFERQAIAQEEANEIARAQIPQPTVGWTFRPVSRDGWEAVNTGDAVALGARARRVGRGMLHVEETIPRDIEPGDAIGFIAQTSAAGTPTIEVTWKNPDGSDGRVERAVRR